MSRGALREVCDGSGDPQGGTGRVGGPSDRSGKGWGTVEGFGTGRRTLGVV